MPVLAERTRAQSPGYPPLIHRIVVSFGLARRRVDHRAHRARREKRQRGIRNLGLENAGTKRKSDSSILPHLPSSSFPQSSSSLPFSSVCSACSVVSSPLSSNLTTPEAESQECGSGRGVLDRPCTSSRSISPRASPWCDRARRNEHRPLRASAS